MRKCLVRDNALRNGRKRETKNKSSGLYKNAGKAKLPPTKKQKTKLTAYQKTESKTYRLPKKDRTQGLPTFYEKRSL